MSQILNGLNIYSITFRLILAVLLGGMIGIDREDQFRPAGLRTHILVCLGTTIAMLTGEFIYKTYGNVGDPSRIGAQILSGIGFLGAGTIIVSGKHVKGLTTAAGLWATACMGLAIGIGFYSLAILGGAFILFTLIILRYITSYLRRRSRSVQIYVELDSTAHVSDLLRYIKTSGGKMVSMDWLERDPKLGGMGLLLILRLPQHHGHEIFVTELENQPFVMFTTEQE
jgi:putative Mg2+ transporter-C (MgtC) family protein